MAVAGAAKRYAQAAFDIARDHGTLDAWEKDLQHLRGVLSDPMVAGFFESPAVSEEAKRKALGSILPDDAQQHVRNLALLLLDRGRIGQLDQVVQVFEELLLEERGIAIADVTTAVELTPEEAAEVRAQLSRIIGKQVEIRPRVDPAIIGGVVVRVGDTLIDGSVQTQLNQLRERLAS